jgi:branched-chain amino acid transport system substrate-binding protein
MKRLLMVRLVLVFTVSLLLLGMITVEANAAQDKVLLGAAISMTGKFAREGGELKGGYDFWRDWVNGRGGMDVGGKKYKVDIIYYDDKSDTMTAAKLTEKLITEDKVNFLLAPYSSGIAFATSAIAERYGYITIAGAANSDALYQRGYKYLFSLLPPASKDFNPTADLLARQKPAPKTVAILSLDGLLTILATDGLRDHIKTLGLEEVYYTKFPAKTTDFSAMLTVIKAKNPDLIFFGGYFEDSVPFLKQCKELNVNAKAYAFLTAPQFDDWTKILGKDGDYVFSVMYWARAMNWKGPYFDVKSFADTFQKQTGTPMRLYHAQGAAGCLLLQIAIEKAGTLNQAKVRDVLSSMDVTTFWGPFKVNEKGENLKGRDAILQVQNGKVVSVDPPDAGAKVNYPTPPWNKR